MANTIETFTRHSLDNFLKDLDDLYTAHQNPAAAASHTNQNSRQASIISSIASTHINESVESTTGRSSSVLSATHSSSPDVLSSKVEIDLSFDVEDMMRTAQDRISEDSLSLSRSQTRDTTLPGNLQLKDDENNEGYFINTNEKFLNQREIELTTFSSYYPQESTTEIVIKMRPKLTQEEISHKANSTLSHPISPPEEDFRSMRSDSTSSYYSAKSDLIEDTHLKPQSPISFSPTNEDEDDFIIIPKLAQRNEAILTFLPSGSNNSFNERELDSQVSKKTQLKAVTPRPFSQNKKDFESLVKNLLDVNTTFIDEKTTFLDAKTSFSLLDNEYIKLKKQITKDQEAQVDIGAPAPYKGL